MMKNLLIASVITLALGAGGSAQAGNLGFETGDLTDWTTNSTDAGAVTSYGSFGAYEGSFIGYAQAGLGPYTYTTLAQTFTLSAGSVLSGVWGFQANDYTPYDDHGYLAINDTTLLSSSVSAVGNYGNTGWIQWSYEAPTDGTYTLEIGAANWIDNGLSSGVVLDGVSVPEPVSVALLGVGVLGLGVVRRRRASPQL